MSLLKHYGRQLSAKYATVKHITLMNYFIISFIEFWPFDEENLVKKSELISSVTTLEMKIVPR